MLYVCDIFRCVWELIWPGCITFRGQVIERYIIVVATKPDNGTFMAQLMRCVNDYLTHRSFKIWIFFSYGDIVKKHFNKDDYEQISHN